MQKSAEFLRVLECKILHLDIHLRQRIFNCAQVQHSLLLKSDPQSVNP